MRLLAIAHPIQRRHDEGQSEQTETRVERGECEVGTEAGSGDAQDYIRDGGGDVEDVKEEVGDKNKLGAEF